MSYDVYFNVKYKDVISDEIFIRNVGEFNYTYNMRKFFDDFLQFNDSNKQGIEGFQGMLAKDAWFVLHKTVSSFNQSDINFDWFKKEMEDKYNSSNGWGSVDTAIKFLTNMMDTCKENPTAVISIC